MRWHWEVREGGTPSPALGTSALPGTCLPRLRKAALIAPF